MENVRQIQSKISRLSNLLSNALESQNMISSFVGGLFIGSTAGTISAGISLANRNFEEGYDKNLDMIREQHLEETREAHSNQPKRVADLDRAYLFGRTVGQVALGLGAIYLIANYDLNGGM